ncbi:Nif11-like leader peptide family natural product precursor [Kutzneria chonburiensis]|jgi:hypothetical protein|uniref:Nif11-like leader peptide family natural product n=1 Tax=Kutzneria chonburiensis TaxID=1483604 RepID=A0ABV6MX22_9PSEU|nr:Nif11-like leader peptide family natural product precursor [Kutzneria chonburiensis]
MSAESFLAFLTAVRSDAAMSARYGRRDLGQLLFHAKNDGFDFTAEDVTAVVGQLEINIIVAKDGEAVDGNSSLWRDMWGRPYLDYVVGHVIARHTDKEIRSLLRLAAA